LDFGCSFNAGTSSTFGYSAPAATFHRFMAPKYVTRSQLLLNKTCLRFYNLSRRFSVTGVVPSSQVRSTAISVLLVTENREIPRREIFKCVMYRAANSDKFSPPRSNAVPSERPTGCKMFHFVASFFLFRPGSSFMCVS